VIVITIPLIKRSLSSVKSLVELWTWSVHGIVKVSVSRLIPVYLLSTSKAMSTARSMHAPVAYSTTYLSLPIKSLWIRSKYTLGWCLRETKIRSFGNGTTRKSCYLTILVSIFNQIKIMNDAVYDYCVFYYWTFHFNNDCDVIFYGDHCGNYHYFHV